MSTHSASRQGDSVLLRRAHNGREAPYTARLDRVSEGPLQPELYSGVHYQFLAQFLSKGPTCGPQTPNGNFINYQRRMRQPNDDFVHVIVHEFLGGIKHNRHDFNLRDGLAMFMQLPHPKTQSNQVAFVRGSLTAAWVEALGTKFKIDPEFFRRHLRYEARGSHLYSDLPSLPSASNEMTTLVLPSLYIRSTPGQVRKSRAQDLDVAKRNQNSISGDMACGETIIRKFSTLTERLFSVEQDISIFKRTRGNGGQIVVVLLDSGLEMNQADGPPCFSRQDSVVEGTSSAAVSPIPIIVPRPVTVQFDVVHPGAPKNESPASPNSICQVASLLPFYLGMSIPGRPNVPDAFVLVGEVFRLVASSECQFLNQLRSLIQDQELDPENEEIMSMAIDTLRYVKSLSEQHRQSLKQNVNFLEARCSAGHDSPGLLEKQQSNELVTFLRDFQELLTRAESLGAFAKETMDLLLNGAMLRESQKAIQRADDQRRLTVLAYLFLLLSLVFAAFGMNVTELGSGSQGIWLPIVLLLPVGCISWMLFNPDMIRKVLEIAKHLFTNAT